jgi:sulfide dehydrogenase [flavocytochrome c] flavoprotein subunit
MNQAMRCSLDAGAPAAGRRRAGRPGLAGCATTASGPSIGRVVVVGGGFGGTTAARYLRLWGGNIDVTLVERNASFVSCPISNLVVGGYKQMADITRGYDGLKALGVKVVQGDVTGIDAAGKKVRLAGGRSWPTTG